MNNRMIKCGHIPGREQLLLFIGTGLLCLCQPSPLCAQDRLRDHLSGQLDRQPDSESDGHPSFESLLSQLTPPPNSSRLGQDTLRLAPVEETGQDASPDDLPRQPSEIDNIKLNNDGPETAVERESDEASDADERSQQADQLQRREVTLSHLMKLRKPISEIRISMQSQVDTEHRPQDRAAEVLAVDAPQLVTASGGHWQPYDRYVVPLCHRPLYFQQPDLERCGRTYRCGDHDAGCWQNTVSGFTFLVNTMVLPYRLATERPDCPVPNQGDCRTCQSTGNDCDPLQPGACGWISEAAAIAGFTFLLL
tara:strand:- start:504900 stop:505823 length:924 start_codon:yes stop_codon:yes gene_type:complete